MNAQFDFLRLIDAGRERERGMGKRRGDGWDWADKHRDEKQTINKQAKNIMYVFMQEILINVASCAPPTPIDDFKIVFIYLLLVGVGAWGVLLYIMRGRVH